VEYCKGAEKAGLKSSKIKYFEDKEKAMDALKLLVCEKDMVLVKGSRSMKLEEISKKLMEIA